MKKVSLLIFLTILFVSCNRHKNRLNVDVSRVDVPDVVIRRYDMDLFSIPSGDLKNGLRPLQAKYSIFLGEEIGDTLKLREMRDYLENERNIEFHDACKAKYPDLKSVEQELTGAFRHLKYYFPDISVPVVYSYISGGDYENPVQLSDNAMIIALDDFLGKDCRAYQADGLPLYKAAGMDRSNIVPGCMSAMADALFPPNPVMNNLLGQMVEAGKKIWFMDAMLPDYPDSLKISYTRKQFEWMTKNESHVWAAIITNKMLWSTSTQVIRMLMADGPFTPEFSRESPPRLGEWIGWQIVKDYMLKNPKVTLKELMMENDPQKILTLSGYKPEE
jgi:hypothetical protein